MNSSVSFGCLQGEKVDDMLIFRIIFNCNFLNQSKDIQKLSRQKYLFCVSCAWMKLNKSRRLALDSMDVIDILCALLKEIFVLNTAYSSHQNLIRLQRIAITSKYCWRYNYEKNKTELFITERISVSSIEKNVWRHFPASISRIK